MRESELEKRVTKFAEDCGILHYKFVSPNHCFVPDHLYITRKGTVFFVEFKQKGKKPGPGQAREIARLRTSKVMVFVIDDVNYGRGVMRELTDS